MRFSYSIKCAEPNLSSGIPSWISQYIWATTFLTYSSDGDLQFLRKNRNIVSKQAICSQITDPAPGGWGVGGGGMLLEGELKLPRQKCFTLVRGAEPGSVLTAPNFCSFLFTSPLLFSFFSSFLFFTVFSSPFELAFSLQRTLFFHCSLLEKYADENK